MKIHCPGIMNRTVRTSCSIDSADNESPTQASRTSGVAPQMNRMMGVAIVPTTTRLFRSRPGICSCTSPGPRPRFSPSTLPSGVTNASLNASLILWKSI